MNNIVNGTIEDKILILKELKNTNYSNLINDVSNEIINCIKNGGKILIAGNGGSASDAQHFAAELVGRFELERKGYPAIALTTDSSVLTSISNDYTYENIFKRQIEALGNKGDIFIAISTSGNSKNVINGVLEAKEKNIKTIGLIGNKNGKLNELCDICISFELTRTARIQELHLLTYHLICEIVETRLKEYYDKKQD